MTMAEKTVQKSLKYEFTEAETKINAKELARQNHAFVEAELKRKQITSDLKADEQRITSEIAKLSRWVNDGYDFRQVECKVCFNDPKTGIKSLYRLDTGELVEQLSMELHEMQMDLPVENPENNDDDHEEDEGDDSEEEPSGNRRPY